MVPPPPPPPIPRRHPSRPSIGSSVSSSSSSLNGSSPPGTYVHLLNPSSSSIADSESSSYHHGATSNHHQHSSSSVVSIDSPTLRAPNLQVQQGSSDGSYASNGGDYFASDIHNYDPRLQGPANLARPSTLSSAAPARAGSPLSAPGAVQPVSPGVSRIAPPQGGRGLGAVGLGPVRIDFKDWVKAGREARETSVDSSPATRKEHEPSHAPPSSGPLTPQRFSLGSPPQAYEVGRNGNGTGNEDTNRPAASLSPRRADHNSPRQMENGSRSARSSIAPRPLSAIRTSTVESTVPSSASMSSLSIDSSHSPQGLLARRTSSRASDQERYASEALQNSTARRLSSDLVRELGTHRPSPHRLSYPPNSPGPASPAGGGRGSPSKQNPTQPLSSPLEHRFSRHLRSPPRTDSPSGYVERVDEDETEVLYDDRQRPPRTLEEQLRAADGQGLGSKRSSLRSDDYGSHVTPVRRQTPQRTAHSGGIEAESPETPETSTDTSSTKPLSSGGRMGKVRQPIPFEFQNGGLFTPSPKEHANNPDMTQSPYLSAREREFRDSDVYNLGSPQSQRSFATARPHSVLETRRDSPLRSWAARSSVVGSNGGTLPRSESRSDYDRFQRGGPGGRREFPTSRNRPESVLETTTERERYDAGMSTPSRMRFAETERSARLSSLIGDRSDSVRGARSSLDFSPRIHGLANEPQRTPLSPNDSASAVGSRGDHGSARNDPLDIIRRLEEARAQQKRRWEEDRSMSVLGDRPSSVYGDRSSRYGEREVLARPASRLDDSGRPSSRMSNASRIRPSSSMMSITPNRDSTYGTPRTQPLTRQRTHSTDASVADSPLLGRTSRASGSFSGSAEPRVVRRSQTSMGSRSAGSSGNEGVVTTEHGKNLVDAARVLDRKLEFDPGIISRLTAAAATGERANAGLHAAAAIVAELALDVEVGDKDAFATVKERLPRLAVTLREAGRSSDQAVRDFTDALLAISGQSTSAPSRVTTPQRRADSAYIVRPEAATEPSHRRRWSTAPDTPVSRPGTAYGGALVQSPSTRFSTGGRETLRETARTERQQPAIRERERERERYDSGTSASSHQEGVARFDGPRSLDPIEQSPPRATSSRTSPVSTARSEALRLSSPLLSDREAPPQPHNSPAWSGAGHSKGPAPAVPEATSRPSPMLRKQPSMASTHTIRPHSFVPSHPPETTTALSSSPAYSQPSLPLTRVTSEDDPQPPLRHSQGHEREPSGGAESLASTGSFRSRNGGEAAINMGAASAAPPAASPEVIERRGTFGVADGAKVRVSVSERFRQHLKGEQA